MMKKSRFIMVVIIAVFANVSVADGNGDDQQRWRSLRMKVDSTTSFFQQRLLLVNPASKRGAELFHNYHNLILIGGKYIT